MIINIVIIIDRLSLQYFDNLTCIQYFDDKFTCIQYFDNKFTCIQCFDDEFTCIQYFDNLTIQFFHNFTCIQCPDCSVVLSPLPPFSSPFQRNNIELKHKH